MVFEDNYINVGDNGIPIKSGWNQYGIAYGCPSKNILIRNLVVCSMVSAGVSIGIEMLVGVSNVTLEAVYVWKSRCSVRIKTSPGRGGYVRQITYRNPNDGFVPKAVPVLEDISYTSFHGEGVSCAHSHPCD